MTSWHGSTLLGHLWAESTNHRWISPNWGQVKRDFDVFCQPYQDVEQTAELPRYETPWRSCDVTVLSCIPGGGVMGAAGRLAALTVLQDNICWDMGLFQYRGHLVMYGIFIIKIRRSWDLLFFIIGILLLVRCLYIDPTVDIMAYFVVWLDYGVGFTKPISFIPFLTISDHYQSTGYLWNITSIFDVCCHIWAALTRVQYSSYSKNLTCIFAKWNFPNGDLITQKSRTMETCSSVQQLDENIG